MSYVSLIKNLPELFGQPAGIAAIASVGLHGALAFILPLMSTPSTSKSQETTTQTVGLMEVPPSDLSRIAQASSAPRIGLPPQNQLKAQVPSSISVLGQPTPPPPVGNGNLSLSVLDQPNVIPNPAALSQLQANGKPYNTSRYPQQGQQRFNLSSPKDRLIQSNPGNIAFNPNIRSSNNPNRSQSPATGKKYTFPSSNAGLVTPVGRRNVIPQGKGPNGQPRQPDLFPPTNLGQEVPNNRDSISVNPGRVQPSFEIPPGGTTVPQGDIFPPNISQNNTPPNTGIALGPNNSGFPEATGNNNLGFPEATGNNNLGFPEATGNNNLGFPSSPGNNNVAVAPGGSENSSNKGNTPAIFNPSTLKNPGELPEATISGSSPIISAKAGTTPDATGNFNIPPQPNGTQFTPSPESKTRDEGIIAYNSWHNSEENKNVFTQFIKEKINSPLLRDKKQDNVLVSATVDEKNNVQISPLLVGNIPSELKKEIENKVREYKFPNRDKKTTYKFQFTIFGGEGNTAQQTPQETPEKVTNSQQQNSPQANTTEKTTPETIKSPEVNKAPSNEDKPINEDKPSLGQRLRDSRSPKGSNSSSENEPTKEKIQSFRPASNLPKLESQRIPSIEFSKPNLSTASSFGESRLNSPAPARGNEVSKKIERRPLAKLETSKVSPRVNNLTEESSKKPEIKVKTETETSQNIRESGSRQAAQIESTSGKQESRDRLLKKMRQRMQENNKQ